MRDYSFQTLDKQTPKNHLPSLETPFGTRSFLDSVLYCNRCGSCLKQCPTYLLTQEEPFSARGRNQLMRFLLERKLKVSDNVPLIKQSVLSCTLCGRCSQLCAGEIFTPHHVLDLRRLLHVRALPTTLFFFLALRDRNPGLFQFLARTALQLRRFGFIKILRFTGLANLCGFSWLHRADKLLPAFEPEKVKQVCSFCAQPENKPALIYLPSLEAQFLLPEVFLSSFRAASQKFRTVVWANTSTGLFEYVYGNLRRARWQLKKLISRHARAGNLPLVTDSMDVYLFLKQAPSLFAGFPRWKQKARAFSTRVRFIASFILPGDNSPQFPLSLATDGLLSLSKEPFVDVQKILQTTYGQNFVKCNYPYDLPAFGYSFGKQNWFVQMAPPVAKAVLNSQIKTVVVVSGWSLLEWQSLMRQNGVSVLHIAQLNR